MIRRPGGARPRPDSLEPGERVLAGALTPEGEWAVVATRSALHLRTSGEESWRRQPWHELHSAGWSAGESVLTIRHRDTAGGFVVRPLPLREAPPLLELLRERIAATVLVQRSVAVPGGLAHVVLRRALGVSAGETAGRPWFQIDHDEGVDPKNPQVSAVVAQVLAEVQEETGAPALAPARECC